MSDSQGEERARAEGAAAERAAILRIVERHLRLLAHGHGAGGAQVLQHLLDELRQREVREAWRGD